MNSDFHVAILGAGPAGLGAAFRLRHMNRARVTVLERNQVVGGNAGSFELQGFHVDYGSHRLHPACAPQILQDIRQFLADDLLDRPRHGRIRLRGRWIHFPLKPFDLVRSLPLGFSAGTGFDLLKKAWPFSANGNGKASFASVLQHGLGSTICRDFYFPYARKIWGIDPHELSAVQARRRVQANSIGKMLRKVLSAVPGLKARGKGRFFYPRRGYGQISEAYCRAARDRGAEFVFGSTLSAAHVSPRGVERVQYSVGDEQRTLQADHVWSTIPITTLVQSIRPEAPPDVLEASKRLRYRSMILIYLALSQAQFTPFDAHYFPESDVPITRMSEPRNYSTVAEPSDRTVLCVELPCTKGDQYWESSDTELGQIVTDSLARLEIPVRAPLLNVTTRRLAQAYPIYDHGYETAFDRMDEWLRGIPNLLTFGRQGLFAHDNTHHALAMAYSAVDCLDERGVFDQSKWQRFREVFETHVVED